jgi:hypothetical protein
MSASPCVAVFNPKTAVMVGFGSSGVAFLSNNVVVKVFWPDDVTLPSAYRQGLSHARSEVDCLKDLASKCGGRHVHTLAPGCVPWDPLEVGSDIVVIDNHSVLPWPDLKSIGRRPHDADSAPDRGYRMAAIASPYLGPSLKQVELDAATPLWSVLVKLESVFAMLVRMQEVHATHQDIKADNCVVGPRCVTLIDCALASDSRYHAHKRDGWGKVYSFFPLEFVTAEYKVMLQWQTVKADKDSEYYNSFVDSMWTAMFPTLRSRDLSNRTYVFSTVGVDLVHRELLDDRTPDVRSKRRDFVRELMTAAEQNNFADEALQMSRVDVFMTGLMLLLFLTRTKNYRVEEDRELVCGIRDLAMRMAEPVCTRRMSAVDAFRVFLTFTSNFKSLFRVEEL